MTEGALGSALSLTPGSINSEFTRGKNARRTEQAIQVCPDICSTGIPS